MSLTQTINYDVAGNFTFDSTRVQVAANKASLKLGNNAGLLFTQNFASDSGFTYDNAKAEFATGLVRQFDQRPANATFGATFATSINGSWGNGDLTGTANNGAAISGGKLDLTGGGNKYVTFDGIDNVSTLTAVGTVRFRFSPNYNGSPVDSQIFLTLRDSQNPNNSLIQLFHASNGSFFLLFNDDTGSNQLSNSVSPYVAVSGEEIEVEMSWDLNTGKVRFFGQGFLVADIDTTFSRSNPIDTIQIGDTGSNFSMRDLVFFSTVQHTANYTAGEYTLPAGAYVESAVVLPAFTYPGPGSVQAFSDFSATIAGSPRFILDGKYWNGSNWVVSNNTYAQATTYANAQANIALLAPVSPLVVKVVFADGNTLGSVDVLTVTYTGQVYPTNDPVITNASSIGLDGLDGFSAVSNASGSDGIKFQLVLGGTAKYWTGSAWATSNGSYAQSNTAAEIEANKAALDLSAGTTLLVRAVLHSADGTTTPDLTTVEVDYNFFAPVASPLTECTCYGFAADILGDVFAETPKLIVELASPIFHGSYIVLPSRKTADLDNEGRWELSLVETTTVSKRYKFSVEYTSDTGTLTTVALGYAAVPNQSSVNIATLIFTAS